MLACTCPFLDWKSVLGAYANNVDPIHMPWNTASDQGHDCLLAGISMQGTIQVRTFTRNS